MTAVDLADRDQRPALPSGMYTLAEAAQRLGIRPRTALNWVNNGVFPVPVRRFGRNYRVVKAVLERFLETGVAPVDREASPDGKAGS